MKTKNMIAGWRTLLAVSLVAVLPFAVQAGKPGSGSTSSFPLRAHIFTQVVDEQDTTAYYNYVDEFCSGNDLPTQVAGLLPDSAPGASTAWPSAFPWSPISGLDSATYVNGMECLSAGACLRSEFNTSNKNFTLDTRTTNTQRTMTLDFGVPYLNTIPLGLPRIHETPGLFELLGTSSFTEMKVCGSRACPEATLVVAKFWFNDPTTSGVQWRVDWRTVRVLRVTETTWHFFADVCDGTQVAGLSKLTGNRTKPRESNQGSYLIPFFIVVDKM